jgi:hypothetical protein
MLSMDSDVFLSFFSCMIVIVPVGVLVVDKVEVAVSKILVVNRMGSSRRDGAFNSRPFLHRCTVVN